MSVRDLGPLRVAPCRGSGVPFRLSGPAFSTGPVSSSKSPRAPGAWTGYWEMRRGQPRADRFRRITITRKTPKHLCGLVVGRLLDAFGKDANGVSPLQH